MEVAHVAQNIFQEADTELLQIERIVRDVREGLTDARVRLES